MTLEPAEDRAKYKWLVCGMLLLALVLNYMDRMTLSVTITAIENQIHTTNEQYGRLEKYFGYAFAIGGLIWGFAADRLSVRWLYPLVLVGWSAAGVATGYADRLGQYVVPLLGLFVDVSQLTLTDNPAIQEPYSGFLACRVILGFFEAGQWPCALVTTQRLLTPQDRPFGNSILQSGASIGAIITPIVVGMFDPKQVWFGEEFTRLFKTVVPQDQPLPVELMGWWRSPYVVIGAMGLLWIGPWLWMVNKVNLGRPESSASPASGGANGTESSSLLRGDFVRRYLGLIVMVIVINMMWQYFRAWLPKILEQSKGYTASDARMILVGFYIAADVGCMAAGWLVKLLAARNWNVHWARVVSYGFCAILTATTMFASVAPRGTGLVLLLMVIGFGALGLFPNYYSFTQELSGRHQGKVSGTLGFITWVVSSKMQELVGQRVDQTGSYADGIFYIGLTPLLGLVAILLLWGRPEESRNDVKLDASKS